MKDKDKVTVALSIGSLAGIALIGVMVASGFAATAMVMHKGATGGEGQDGGGEAPSFISPHDNPTGSYSENLVMGITKEKIEAMYGPLNKDALDETKEGIFRNIACRSHNRRQLRRQAWTQYRADVRQLRQVQRPCYLQPSQPSYPVIRPYVGPSVGPTPKPVVVETKINPEVIPAPQPTKVPAPALIEIGNECKDCKPAPSKWNATPRISYGK